MRPLIEKKNSHADKQLTRHMIKRQILSHNFWISVSYISLNTLVCFLLATCAQTIMRASALPQRPASRDASKEECS